MPIVYVLSNPAFEGYVKVGRTVDLHKHLIEVPAPMTKPAHPVHPLPANVGGEHRSEPVPPEPHRLVADVDTALRQQVLDVP